MSVPGAIIPVSSMRILLHRLIDYAGLFPPASLNMMAAVAEYAKHRQNVDSWVLGRFVLPAARLDEFDAAAGSTLPREGRHSWALSALLENRHTVGCVPARAYGRRGEQQIEESEHRPARRVGGIG